MGDLKRSAKIMSSNVILINKLSDWTDLDNALIGEAEGFISSVSRLKMIEELNCNSSIIEIVMSTLYGQADLALEIFWTIKSALIKMWVQLWH